MKLSIITINYNNKAGLEKTIASVMSQTWRDFEWIIIDGGSTDGSKELIQSTYDLFEQEVKDSLHQKGGTGRVFNSISYWCSEPDKGIYNAMNKGIAKARGEYLNFMNSGDCFYEKETLEKVFDKDYDEDIIVGNVIRGDNGEILRELPSAKYLIKHLIYSTLNHQGSFIKRSLQQRFLYDDSLRIVSDWKFYLQAVTFGKADIRFIDNIIAVNDMNGISNTDGELIHNERNRVKEEVLSLPINDILEQHYYLMSHDLIKNTEYLRAHNVKLYILCRRFVSLITKLSNFL